MNSILEALHIDDPSSLKRFLVGGASALLVLATPLFAKVGIPTPSDTAIEMFAGIVATYLLQSGARSIATAVHAGKAASDAIDNQQKADDVIKTAIAREAEAEAKP